MPDMRSGYQRRCAWLKHLLQDFSRHPLRLQSSTMSSDNGGDPSAFLADYQQEGGWYNEEAFGLARYPGMGLGGVALQDIEVCLCPVLDLVIS